MNKKADANWFVVMAIIALVALLSMLMISGGVFSKFFNGLGGIASDVDVKVKCAPGPNGADSDMDRYKAGEITIDGKIYTCDSNDGDPNINYEKGDKSKTTNVAKK
jgi:hypothetical protein